MTQSLLWLSDIDHYALLVAALCHDIGHRGKTNAFLVETGHELALRYNDKSPLENMHCASLSQLLGQEKTDVFKRIPADTRKHARKVYITSILHTDLAMHFEMVKDINKLYEMASDICDEQAAEPTHITANYRTEVLRRDTMRWLELFLHLADVSNPLKPFDICKRWAWRVLDEFFAQGDEEKRLSIPVGMLNDRDKTNRPGSQHGFINLLVAPLVLPAVRLFPQLHPLATLMAANLQEWRNIWIDDAKPSEEDIARRDGEVTKVLGIAQDLAARVARHSVHSVRQAG